MTQLQEYGTYCSANDSMVHSTQNNHTTIPENSQHECQNVIYETCFVGCFKKELTCQEKTYHAQQVPKITSFVVIVLAFLGIPQFLESNQRGMSENKAPPNKKHCQSSISPTNRTLCEVLSPIIPYTEVSWKRGTPSHHPFIDGVVHEINHPAIGGIPIYWNPHLWSSWSPLSSVQSHI